MTNMDPNETRGAPDARAAGPAGPGPVPAAGALRPDLALLNLHSRESGPKRATTLLSRGAPMASTAVQRRTLADLEISGRKDASDFDAALAACGWGDLR